MPAQPNMQQLMKQAQQMQQQLMAAQDQLAGAEVEGSAGGGLVRVTMTGAGEVTAVTIDAKVVDPDDVETLQDLVVAVEKTREFRGRYHVLGGAISPIEGVGPDDLRVRELMTRLADGEIVELILATDPNLEGEATATYLIRMLSPYGLRVSKLASGLPVGGDLEYADELTLGRAFEGRTTIASVTNV